jgi:hypothetical protein
MNCTAWWFAIAVPKVLRSSAKRADSSIARRMRPQAPAPMSGRVRSKVCMATLKPLPGSASTFAAWDLHVLEDHVAVSLAR